ncbi:hypothetical protein [Kitasatospora kifunensis]|uniref:Esterase n=1 Tax=Kitasatospora kifunensis TaxID=58351 RepID=A0A7W7R449_KITKI|nr:hypothetical protein [Kitasatospora kifunensis]MBB4924844.1 hypothetical protein [Kitasatospora kifunensis]
MPSPLLLLLVLVPVLLLACWLAHGAWSRWRGEQSARTYELTADSRPAVLRLIGAVGCGLCATGLAVAVVLSAQAGWGGGVRQARAQAGAAADAVRAAPAAARPAPPPNAAPGSAAPSAALPSAASPSAGLPSAGSPSPGSPSASSSSAKAATAGPAATRFVTVGHPAEGELLQADLPGANGRLRAVRVWLPPHYADDLAARFPVIVLHAVGPGRTADAELPDIYEGLASAIKLNRAHPFIAVAPAAPTGTEHPCDLIAAAPQALGDDAGVRTAVAAAFRTLPPGPQGWGALGVEGGAPCAVAAGLTRPDLYRAAAGVSGRFDATALARAAAGAPPGTAPRQLLLAVAKTDADGQSSAQKLVAALHAGKGAAPKTVVTLSKVVQDSAPDGARLQLVRLAAQYLSDLLVRPAG